MNMPDDIEFSASEHAIRWLSWLFRVSLTTLAPSQVIGRDLTPSPRSFYKGQTIDLIVDDVLDMRKLLNCGRSSLNESLTVADFCHLARRIRETNPAKYQRIVRSWERMIGLDKEPKWRRLLFKVVGI
jgi:hypothetical protein